MRKLIGMLMALGAMDPQTVQSLCDTALDAQQDKSLRRSALELLRRIGAPAAGVVEALKEQAGYENAGMRGDFLKTARVVSGD